MKANQRSMSADEDGVSPVIAVILLVAITVVLSATVYAWVGGFGPGSGSARSVSFASGGALSTGGGQNTDNKTYVLVAASPGLKWTGLNLTLDGGRLDYSPRVKPHAGEWCIRDPGSGNCKPGREASGLVSAGAELLIAHSDLSGRTLRALDVEGNNVLATIVVR